MIACGVLKSEGLMGMAPDFGRNFLNEFVTMLVVIDPIGSVPLLAAATVHLKPDARRKIVMRGVLIAGCVLMGFAVFGHLLLTSMGISFSSFRIAGGIILFIVGLQMVFHDHAEMKDAGVEMPGRDLAVFPIALPYIAGPGAMLAIMVENQSVTDAATHFSMKIMTLVLVMLVTLVVLLSTTRLNRMLGRTGSEVIGRVMGILLAALAAESVVRGVLEAFGRTPI
jgi:multiple antibiotic resistance protein